MKSRSCKLAIVAAVAVFASGCSYFTMQRPEKLDADMPVCVSNRLAPTIDSVQAASHGIGTLLTIRNAAAAASRGLLSNASGGYVAGAIIGGIGATVIWTASAVSGFKRAKACERVKRGYYADLNEGPDVRYYDTSANQVRETDRGAIGESEDERESGEPKASPEDESSGQEGGTTTSENEPTGEPPKEGEKESEYMSVIEAAMHCGSSRRDIWDKIDGGTFSTRQTEEGSMLLREEVEEECGEEPEVPMD